MSVVILRLINSPAICPKSETSLSGEGQVIPLFSLHGFGISVYVCICQFGTNQSELAKVELIHSIILRVTPPPPPLCPLPLTHLKLPFPPSVLLSARQAALTRSYSHRCNRWQRTKKQTPSGCYIPSLPNKHLWWSHTLTELEDRLVNKWRNEWDIFCRTCYPLSQ